MSAPHTSVIPPISMNLRQSDPAQFARQLGASFREYGFAVVSDHGLDPSVLEKAHACAEQFFALPEDVKTKYHVPDGGGQRGYVPFGTERAKGMAHHDLKEFWHVGRSLPEDHIHSDIMHPNLSVSEIPDWSDATNAMFDSLDALGNSILSSIAIDLGIDEDWFADAVRDGNSILRLLHYPPQMEPPPEGSVRAAAHGDINVITLLLGAEEGGLEILSKQGDWLPVNPPPNCIVVNIGDMLERLTNHVLPSTQHRVVNPAPERARHPRYSTPYFLHFRPGFLVETLSSCIGPDNPNKYPDPILAHDFLLRRLKEIALA